MYSIVLTSVALILALVVMNNHVSLMINSQSIEVEKEFYINIKSNTDTSSQGVLEINNDGWGFVDNISCPGSVSGSELIIMSGSTKREEIKSALFDKQGQVICLSDYNNKDLEIFFNDNHDWFSKATYNNQTINLSSWPDFIWNFTTDNTKITISEDSYNESDWFDDNFNNDNYQSDVEEILQN